MALGSAETEMLVVEALTAALAVAVVVTAEEPVPTTMVSPLVTALGSDGTLRVVAPLDAAVLSVVGRVLGTVVRALS